MRELLTLVSLLVGGVVAEAPYAPSGWRPDGPAFVIPERNQFVSPQQQYLPPVDPRRPLTPNNFDEGDVSVQGLPSIEPQPIFEVSPINGQQFTGPGINADVDRLNPSFQQAQYQQQLERARQFARQREFENNLARVPSNGLPNQQSPRQFASPTTSTTTPKPEFKTVEAETTTESINLNKGETLDEPNTRDQKDKVAVEVTKQNLQEYPPELFLSPLAQLKLQPQFVPFGPQFGQLRAPLFYQPAQLQDGRSPGFDGPAHLSALPSVLAQRELLSQQAQGKGQGFAQNPIIVQQQPSFIQEPINQYQPVRPVQRVQPVQPVDPVQNEESDQDDEPDVESIQSGQPTKKQGQPLPQFQGQQVILQQQPINQIQLDQFRQSQLQFQPQPQVQYQPQQIQPQLAQPNQFTQPQLQFQPQPQLFQPQQAQANQFPQPQLQLQPQPAQPNQFPQPQLQFQPQPSQPNPFPQPQLQFQPQPAQPNQFPQPQLQFQPQPAQPNQFLQPERPKDVEEIEPTDQQVVYQNYQPQFYQPQIQANQYQTPEQPLLVAQPQQPFAFQNQDQFYQNQFLQQQYDPSLQAQTAQPAPQDGQPLQSGFDINQQGNDIDQQEEQENEQEEEGPRVTAVATAFGTRTQPRVFAQYGAPIPKVQENPGLRTTTESAMQEEPQDEDAPAVAQATAVSTGRRNAKLRSRRIRPIFTLDRSGHLVLAQQQ
ncbi:putative mediator of RNA polymerase II transcription subunit 12 [Pararge aegeria]|uniref:putative mediator of RNA polymerase II transcription subunit 12 n=1 Tax=Pararge aegeria TaxID=116150 RepID=UPI0019D1E652|nr:putative mediator of RNA polymerase II transcription subunit 12 [Pararge aegeria]